MRCGSRDISRASSSDGACDFVGLRDCPDGVADCVGCWCCPDGAGDNVVCRCWLDGAGDCMGLGNWIGFCDGQDGLGGNKVCWGDLGDPSDRARDRGSWSVESWSCSGDCCFGISSAALLSDLGELWILWRVWGGWEG